MSAALAEAKRPKIDLVMYDACLMANWDVLAETAPSADYVISSEELVPGLGFDYDAFNVFTDPSAAMPAIFDSLADRFRGRRGRRRPRLGRCDDARPRRPRQDPRRRCGAHRVHDRRGRRRRAQPAGVHRRRRRRAEVRPGRRVLGRVPRPRRVPRTPRRRREPRGRRRPRRAPRSDPRRGRRLVRHALVPERHRPDRVLPHRATRVRRQLRPPADGTDVASVPQRLLRRPGGRGRRRPRRLRLRQPRHLDRRRRRLLHGVGAGVGRLQRIDPTDGGAARCRRLAHLLRDRFGGRVRRPGDGAHPPHAHHHLRRHQLRHPVHALRSRDRWLARLLAVHAAAHRRVDRQHELGPLGAGQRSDHGARPSRHARQLHARRRRPRLPGEHGPAAGRPARARRHRPGARPHQAVDRQRRRDPRRVTRSTSSCRCWTPPAPPSTRSAATS